MSNLKPAPLFLTPQVVRGVLGLGSNGKGMAQIEVVPLCDTGERCSHLRLNVLRAIRDAVGRHNQYVCQREAIAAHLSIPVAALDEHILALRNCECLRPAKWRLMLTAKGFQKLAMADYAARQSEQDTPADTTTHLQGSQGDGGFFHTFPAPVPLAHPIGATPAPSAADHHAQDGETQQLCDPCTDAALGNLSAAIPSPDRERVTTDEPAPPAARPKRARVAKPEPAKERKFSAGSGEGESIGKGCDGEDRIYTERYSSPDDANAVRAGEVPTSPSDRGTDGAQAEHSDTASAGKSGRAAHVETAPLAQAKPKIRDWMTERRERLNAAIVFLKSQAVLVTQWDRGAQIPRYQVSGKRDLKFAEEVIEIAIGMGWSE